MNFKEIIRENRTRKEYNNVQELAEDIYIHGLIHPICISEDNILIAGGRRSKALEYILRNPNAFPDLTIHPDIEHFILSEGELVFGVTYTTKIVDSLKKLNILELTENIQRENFTWQEEVLGIKQVHDHYVREKSLISENWTHKATGKLFKVSRGHVSSILLLAEHLQDESSPIWKCSGVVEALQYVVKLRSDEATKALAERAKQRASAIPTSTNITPIVSKLVSTFNPNDYLIPKVNITGPSDEPNDETTKESAPIIDTNQIEASLQTASKFVIHADCFDFFQTQPAESVDHIITDPPYGIDMAQLKQTNQGQKDIDRIEETHGVEDNETNFQSWLEMCYKILKPNGYCIWFCDIMQWQTLYSKATELGFKVQRWPFTWVKTTRCMNQRAEFNFTKSVEFAMIMRKGSGRLVKTQPDNYFIGGLTAEDKAACVNHPFIKPKELWLRLAEAVAEPNSLICDPFSGVGSSTRAFLLGGFRPLAVEVSEIHYHQQLQNIGQVLRNLEKGIKQ